jgi:hypothetical protein
VAGLREQIERRFCNNVGGYNWEQPVRTIAGRIAYLFNPIIETIGNCNKAEGAIKPFGVRFEVNYSVGGDPRAVVRYNSRRRMAYCRVEFYDRSREIAAFRDRYLRWWDAMTALAAGLDDSDLKRWSVIRPAADREPWLSQI